MIILERVVHFEEVDAAGIVFFGRYMEFAHEAMEEFFASLDGGYARLILHRKMGFPAVQVNTSFSAPLRFGDTLRIETTTARLGNRSATLRYRMFRKADNVLAAELEHTFVMTNLSTMTSCDMPEDVRAILTSHLVAKAPST